MATLAVMGGAGYIGSHVASALHDAGHQVLIFDNFEEGHRTAVAGFPCFEGDLRDADSLERFFGSEKVDAVLNFAAYISVGESVRDPGKYYLNNTAGVVNLLNAMARAGVKNFLFSSTAAIFGEPEYVPIDEAHPKAPASPYGVSKYLVEQMLPSYEVALGMRSVCLRYFNASGAHPEARLGEAHRVEEHLIPLAIFAVMGKRAGLKVFGTDYPTPDGTCVRDYVHVCDLASAHVLAIESLMAGGVSTAYNLGYGRGFSVREVMETVGRVMGKSVPSEDAPRRPGDPATLIAASDKIRTELGWSPKFDNLEEIVRHAVTWHESMPANFS